VPVAGGGGSASSGVMIGKILGLDRMGERILRFEETGGVG
jgi:hypothetical protein